MHAVKIVLLSAGAFFGLLMLLMTILSFAMKKEEKVGHNPLSKSPSIRDYLDR